jgi:hypothetical protein
MADTDLGPTPAKSPTEVRLGKLEGKAEVTHPLGKRGGDGSRGGGGGFGGFASRGGYRYN